MESIKLQVYTKLSYSLLSQCVINWIVPWVNRLVEYICVYMLRIGSISSMYIQCPNCLATVTCTIIIAIAS